MRFCPSVRARWMDIRELKQRRFSATHFNREWTFYILGTFLGSVFAQICRQIVFIRGKKLCNTNLVASREKASFPVDVRRLSSLLARPVSVFLWTKTRKKKKGTIFSHLDRANLVNEGFTVQPRERFLPGPKRKKTLVLWFVS